jgi:imidazole glycerol-phosphate synthase subunit HisH
MIAVINYGMGNSGSIINMLRRLGQDVLLTSRPGEIVNAEKLVLPGVGAFDNGMQQLHKLGLVPVLTQKVTVDRTPIIGICLGMQLFARCSEEGSSKGLGWIDAEVIRFRQPEGTHLTIPHMGWNTIRAMKPHPLTNDLEPDARFYFVHAYHVRCARSEDVLSVTDYGGHFTSAIASGPVIGVQFHPEKSLRWGMQLFRRFVADEFYAQAESDPVVAAPQHRPC